MTDLREKRHDLYERPPVRVYGAMSIAMLNYPYRLGRVDEYSPTVADKAEHYIMDSGIGNEDVTTMDVIEKANYVDADVIVPKDVIDDPVATAEAVQDLYDNYDQLEDTGTVLVPVQRDEAHTYAESLALLPEPPAGVDIWYGVGGIKEAGTVEQIQRTVDLREILGCDERLHAFGCGASMPWVRTIVACPWLLDSLDLSTPAQLSSRGMMLHGELDKHNVQLPRGTKTTAMSTQLCEFSLMLFCWYLTGLPNEQDLSYEFGNEDIRDLVDDHTDWHDQAVDENPPVAESAAD